MGNAFLETEVPEMALLGVPKPLTPGSSLQLRWGGEVALCSLALPRQGLSVTSLSGSISAVYTGAP